MMASRKEQFLEFCKFENNKHWTSLVRPAGNWAKQPNAFKKLKNAF